MVVMTERFKYSFVHYIQGEVERKKRLMFVYCANSLSQFPLSILRNIKREMVFKFVQEECVKSVTRGLNNQKRIIVEKVDMGVMKNIGLRGKQKHWQVFIIIKRLVTQNIKNGTKTIKLVFFSQSTRKSLENDIDLLNFLVGSVFDVELQKRKCLFSTTSNPSSIENENLIISKRLRNIQRDFNFSVPIVIGEKQ
jgi:hypothetical protein